MGRLFFNGKHNVTHPTTWKWGDRRGRAWTEDEVTEARFMRHCGMKDRAIGDVLKRSTKSVRGKIGYVATRKYTKSFKQAPRLAA